MSRLILSLLPNDRAILTAEDDLTQRQVSELRAAWRAWQENGGLAIVSDCRVQRIESIELLLRDGELAPA